MAKTGKIGSWDLRKTPSASGIVLFYTVKSGAIVSDFTF